MSEQFSGTLFHQPSSIEVPEPKRGGTFFYCVYAEFKRDVGGLTLTTCGMQHSRYTGTRFRTATAYRRHWRKAHS